ncbi:MAG: HD-GYP domain-containing protein [Deltaproteobacteria bacterium]|nr:HD-GYP domain-containing protein [Deltaproteobacteria bacterium]
MSRPKNRLQKIQTKDLAVGMFVHDVGRKWFGHPWARKRKLITSKEDIRQLLEYGIEEVTIDLDRGVPRQKIPDQVEQIEKKPYTIEQTAEKIEERPKGPTDIVSMEEELPRARETYFSALQTTREFLSDARAGREVNIPKVQANVEDIIDSTFRNRDASLALIKLKTYDEYTLTHSLNVAVLSISMGCHANFPREKIRDLGLGAILHDLGKTQVPYHILNKEGPLDEIEYNTIKSHPVVGADMLEKTRKIPEKAVSIARYHHERMDGSGYPLGLSGKELNDFTIITGLSDVYDALTSDRVYRKSIPPHDALRAIFLLRGKQFDELWVEKFTQCLGIYPAGTLVKLNSEEIAVVLNVNRTNLLRPRVRIIFDSKGIPISGKKIIDLQETKFLDLKILEVLNPKSLRLDLSIYF